MWKLIIVLIGLTVISKVIKSEVKVFNFKINDELNLKVLEKNELLILESEKKDIHFIISWANPIPSSLPFSLLVQFKIEDDDIAIVKFGEKNVTSNEVLNQTMFDFQIEGKFVGTSQLLFELKMINDNHSTNLTKVNEIICPIKVIRKIRLVHIIFPVCVGFMIALNNINMGCFLNFEVIKKVLQRPVAPSIGLASQFLVMPLGSYIYGYLYFSGYPAWRLGLFILGCSPGGSLSNFYTLLFDGDVDLSITMTFFSTIVATFMMPFWIYTLGHSLTDNSDLKIPYANILLSIVALTIPLSFGILIRKHRPNWVSICKKIIKPCTILVIVCAVTGGVISNLYIFKLITYKVILAGMSVAWSGYFFGATFATLSGLKTDQIVTISIETALQNPGIAFVVLYTSLPEPESDLAIVPVVGQLMMTGPPTWTVLCFYFIIKWFLKNNEKKKANKDETTINEKLEGDKKHVMV